MSDSKNSMRMIMDMMLSKDKPATSINIADTQRKIIDSIKDSVALSDSYGNTLTGTGSEDKIKSFANYGFSNDTNNFPLWLALYNDSWVFRRAIDKPSQDQVRCGITIHTENEIDLNSVYKDLKKYRNDLIQLLQWGKLFGGSVAVMMFDNYKDEDYQLPINDTKVKKSKVMRLYVTDRWYGVAPVAYKGKENVDNMSSLDFGKPYYYTITFADGKSLLVHHDYILRYENRNAPKLIKNGQLQGWGYAEGAHILNEISRDDQLKSDITSLVNKSLIEVVKMSGMTGIFMGKDEDNEQQLKERLEMVNWARNFNSLTFLDKDDEYIQNEFSGLSGLSDLLEKNMWLVSSALDMQGVLYGHLNNGFSEDNEALERYDETIQNLNESYYRPVLQKLLWVEYKRYSINELVEFDFNSLLSAKQDKDRMEGLKDFKDLLSGLLSDGVITTQQYAKSVRSFIKDGVLDLHIEDDDIEKLSDEIENEMENINLDGDQDNPNDQQNPFEKKNENPFAKKEEVKENPEEKPKEENKDKVDKEEEDDEDDEE